MSEIHAEGVELVYGDAVLEVYNMVWDDSSKPTLPQLYHTHNYYEAHIVIDGKDTIAFSDGEFTIGNNQMYIVPPETAHHSTLHEESKKNAVIHFVLRKIEGKSGFYKYFSSLLSEFSTKPVTMSENFVKAAFDINNVLAEYDIKKYIYLYSRFAELMNLMFAELESKSDASHNTQFSGENREVLIVLDNLVCNRMFSLKQIAEIIGYSPRNTARLILSKYKMPLTDLRRSFAVDTAKKMLSDKSKNLSDIAYLSGFKNVKALNSAFIKQESVSPSQYRLTLTKEN